MVLCLVLNREREKGKVVYLSLNLAKDEDSSCLQLREPDRLFSKPVTSNPSSVEGSKCDMGLSHILSFPKRNGGPSLSPCLPYFAERAPTKSMLLDPLILNGICIRLLAI